MAYPQRMLPEWNLCESDAVMFHKSDLGDTSFDVNPSR